MDLEKEGFTVIYGFEEAIGYMCNTNVIDKDGVSAFASFAGLANHCYGNNQQLCDKLAEIFNIYGLHLSLNSYYFCYDPPKIEEIFTRIRNINGPKKVSNI